MHYLLFLLLATIWGSSFILMKKATLAFGPISIGGLRVLGGALILGAMCLLWRRGWRPAAGERLAFAALILLGYLWPYCMQPFLIADHGSGFIGMMVGLVPLLTVLVSIPLLRILPTARQIVGVLGGLLCLGLIMRDGIDRDVSIAHLGLAVTVPLCYAIANTVVKQRFADAPPLPLSAWCLGLSALLLVPLGMSTEEVERGADLPLAAGAVALLGVLGTGLAILILYRLIQMRGPLFAGMVTYLIPLGAVLWGWADDERVTVLQVVALIGILTMVALVQIPPRRRNSVQAVDPRSRSCGAISDATDVSPIVYDALGDRPLGDGFGESGTDARRR